MEKKVWKRLLGYDPDKSQKELILSIVQEEKISLAEACGRMAMPPIIIEGKDVPDYDNPFRPAILIRTRKESDTNN